MPQPSNEPKQVIEGTVHSFDDGKGFGFIRRDGAGERDVYVHFSNIKGFSGHRQLFPGERVSFEVCDTGRGPSALNVHLLSERRSSTSDQEQTA